MRQPSPRVRRMLRPLTVPASAAYAAVVAARNRRFDRGVGVQRIDRPVISVGNITTGGTGKTPMVAWIARELVRQKRTPVIAMRGYMARRGELSDEQAEYQAILPDVSVVADADRAAALRKFLPKHAQVDRVILDDGFQHRQLHRDLDIVLIDASANTFQDELLPAGDLREPLDGLSRADAVIVTHADEGIEAAIAQEIDRWHGQPPIAWTRHAWSSLCLVRGSLQTEHHARPVAFATNHEPPTTNTSWLRGKRLVTMLGVGNPHAILKQVEAAGAHVMASVKAGDHERYDVAQLATARGLCDGSDGLLVTRKDWVKIEPLLAKLGRWTARILVPQLELEFVEGEAAVRALLERVTVDAGVDR